MAFEILWTDHADLAGTYDSRHEAEADMLAYLDEHPEHADEVALLEVDDDGKRVGDLISGHELLAGKTAVQSGRNANIARAVKAD